MRINFLMAEVSAFKLQSNSNEPVEMRTRTSMGNGIQRLCFDVVEIETIVRIIINFSYNSPVRKKIQNKILLTAIKIHLQVTLNVATKEHQTVWFDHEELRNFLSNLQKTTRIKQPITLYSLPTTKIHLQVTLYMYVATSIKSTIKLEKDKKNGLINDRIHTV